MGLYYQPISAVCLKLSVGTERQSHKAHPSRFIEVLNLRSSLIQYKHCGPKINTFSQRYGRGCDSVSFMIVSHSYLIQNVSGENVTYSAEVTLVFSRRQIFI